ncbi:MAG: C1 family peptidase, partial [Candidatus Bathyarchaeota archaeon]
MKELFSKTIFTLLLVGILAFTICIPSVRPSFETTEGRAIVVEHEITSLEQKRLKQEVGVYGENVDYSQIINGHGTGVRPPTEEEWIDILGNTFIVEKIMLDDSSQIASSVDQTATPWFPPIGNQDGEGSCTAWAVGYYMKTFQEAYEHGWDLSLATWEGGYYGNPTPEYQNRIVSPDFIYHLINGGADGGSSFYDAITLVCGVGASSWETMPYSPLDHTSWPAEAAWREAPRFRGSNTGYEYMWLNDNDDIVSLRNWIASNHLAIIGVDATKYASLTSEDVWTVDNYVNPIVNHANTIVGYDDTRTYWEDGQLRQGAFKIANSWGEGGWENVADGCFWISYKAMKERVRSFMFYRDRTAYTPELFASFHIDHSRRADTIITVGLGSHSTPTVTKSFSQYIDGGYLPFCPNNIIFDVTEFIDVVPTVYNKSFFIQVYDGGSPTTGAILGFAINYAHSEQPPINTVQGSNVYADAVLGQLAVTVYADRYTYHIGDPMYVGLDIVNPGSRATVCLVIWIEKPSAHIEVIRHYHAVALPTGLEYSSPSFMSFTISSIPSGVYTWRA